MNASHIPISGNFILAFGRVFPVIDWLFSTEGFLPRRSCGAWSPELIWLHSGSDIMIWLAYLSIPMALIYFARHQPKRIVNRLVILFAAFILCCGFTHFIDAFMFDYPRYHLAGVMKLVTAVVSWVTVLALIPAPLGLGTLELIDGRPVHGFLCEHHALEGAREGGAARHGGGRRRPQELFRGLREGLRPARFVSGVGRGERARSWRIAARRWRGGP